jgi:hypothetical protein
MTIFRLGAAMGHWQLNQIDLGVFENVSGTFFCNLPRV